MCIRDRLAPIGVTIGSTGAAPWVVDYIKSFGQYVDGNLTYLATQGTGSYSIDGSRVRSIGGVKYYDRAVVCRPDVLAKRARSFTSGPSRPYLPFTGDPTAVSTVTGRPATKVAVPWKPGTTGSTAHPRGVTRAVEPSGRTNTTARLRASSASAHAPPATRTHSHRRRTSARRSAAYSTGTDSRRPRTRASQRASDAAVSAEHAASTAPGAVATTSAASGVVTAACGAAAARVRRLTEAEVTRAGESLTDAGTDTIDGRPVLRRMGIVRRSLGRCVPTVGGAWVLALRSIERGEGEGGTLRFRVRWAADFVTTAGARVDGPERTALVDEGCDHDELDAFAGSDIDGDGRGELAFAGTHYWCGDGDGDAPIPVTVLTARGDRVAPYAPFAVVGAVESFTDFDRDGRLDFVDAERWGRIVDLAAART